MSDKKNNTGDMNTGDRNTGDRNTGNRNTGDRNTGHWNTGNRNTGHWNTGNMNTGNMNTGDMNTGHRNTGNWNTGNKNTGLFCTNEPQARLFNASCQYTMTELYQSDKVPDFSAVKLTVWVQSDAMTDEEKSDHPEHETTGGYLRQLEYKVAWAEAWLVIPESEKEKLKNLPNFNADIFMEITGIDIRMDAIVEIDGKKYRRVDVTDRIKELTPIK